jgi:hypothetical protein
MYHLKPYLKERGYNLSALAKKMEMSFQRFDYHCKPKVNLPLNFSLKLSTILGITLDDFIKSVKVDEVKKESNMDDFDNQPFAD